MNAEDRRAFPRQRSRATMRFLRDILEWKGRRVTVVGLGLFGGGSGLAKYLVRHGAEVTVTDLRPASALTESMAEFAEGEVRWVLGHHDEKDFTTAGVVCPGPGVPAESPYLQAAAAAGVPFETEIGLVAKLCPCPIAGVTGTNGKTTTSLLLGAMLGGDGVTVHVGGNIGGSLLSCIDEISPEDRVVLELSSFQLDFLGAIGWSPHVAVVTNLAQNHLDRHGTMEAYAAAKRQILAYQKEGDGAVLNAADPVVASWVDRVRGRRRWFHGAAAVTEGAYWEGEYLTLVPGGHWLPREEVRLPGDFNVENVLAAAAAARLFDAFPEFMAEAVRSFRGVPHRLEEIVVRDGVRWVNDSIATNPRASLAGLRALRPPRSQRTAGAGLVVLAGGSDKGLDYGAWGAWVRDAARVVIPFGAIGPRLADAAGGGQAEVRLVSGLDEAVAVAAEISRSGDTVVLSPASASFDAFRNFTERGDRFRALVLPEEG